MGRLEFGKPRRLRDGDCLEGFHCGVELVDGWLANRAHSAQKTGTAVVYVSFCEEGLAGFYSLSSQSVAREGAGGWIARNAPVNIPVILLGMLGVDERYQGVGLGHDLLLDAVRRSMLVAQQIGARAIVVEPAGSGAAAFYRQYGFKEVRGTRYMAAKL